MMFTSVQMKSWVARRCFVGPRLFGAHQGRAADLQKKSALLLLLLAGFLIIAPRNVLAHPMGNFSVSHFAGLRIETNAVELRYILDMAEIPTFQEMQATGIAANPDDPEVLAYLNRKSETLKNGLVLTLNGRPLSLEVVSENVIFPPGAGNLPTMKIGVVYRAQLLGATCQIGRASCRERV